MADQDEVRVLRERVAALERERADEIVRANAAVAAAQDRSYWLDRWHVDLNRLMQRPGASEARAALRALRAVYRAAYSGRSKLGAAFERSGERLRHARRTVADERKAAERLAATSPREPAD